MFSEIIDPPWVQRLLSAVVCASIGVGLLRMTGRHRSATNMFRLGTSATTLRHRGLGKGLLLGPLLIVPLAAVGLFSNQNGLHPFVATCAELSLAVLVSVLFAHEKSVVAEENHSSQLTHENIATTVGVLGALWTIGKWAVVPL